MSGPQNPAIPCRAHECITQKKKLAKKKYEKSGSAGLPVVVICAASSAAFFPLHDLNLDTKRNKSHSGGTKEQQKQECTARTVSSRISSTHKCKWFTQFLTFLTTFNDNQGCFFMIGSLK